MTKVSLWLESLKIYFFCLFKVPMLRLLSGRVRHIDKEKATIEIPLKRITKNYYQSMYFGAICMGAELVVMYLAEHIRRYHTSQYSLTCKSFDIQFIKRATQNVHFECDEGHTISNSINKAIESNSRLNTKIKGKAYIIADGQIEIISEFTVELSIKQKQP